MIEPEYYQFPHAEPHQQPTAEQRRQATETLAYLESLPWQPHGIEW